MKKNYAFISYSTRWKTDAEALRFLLNKNHIETWMAPYDIPSGNSYADVINKAIRNASCFVLLLSEEAQRSPWVPRETERAINYEKPILAVKTKDIILNDEFEFFLSRHQICVVPKIDDSRSEIKDLIKQIRFFIGNAKKESEKFCSEEIKILEFYPKIREEEILEENKKSITIMGIGGAGNNLLNFLLKQNFSDRVHFISVTTDKEMYPRCECKNKILLRVDEHDEFKTNGDPEEGKRKAEWNKDLLRDKLMDKILIVTCGLGRGTGSGVSPVVIREAKEKGILTISLVTYPFEFEKKNEIAEKAVSELEASDILIIVHNQALMKKSYKELREALSYMNGILEEIVRIVISHIENSEEETIAQIKQLAAEENIEIIIKNHV